MPEEKEPDVVWGADAIGAVINTDRRQTYHLLYSGALEGAARKVGDRWVASRRKLLARILGEAA